MSNCGVSVPLDDIVKSIIDKYKDEFSRMIDALLRTKQDLLLELLRNIITNNSELFHDIIKNYIQGNTGLFDPIIEAFLRSNVDLLKALLPDTYVKSGKLNKKTNKLVFTLTNGETFEVSLCGWRGEQPCEYRATLQIPLGTDCKTPFTRIAWAFHPEDIRDRNATVAIREKDTDRIIGYIYPDRTDEHDIDIEVDGVRVGFALSSPIVKVWDDKCCTGNCRCEGVSDQADDEDDFSDYPSVNK